MTPRQIRRANYVVIVEEGSYTKNIYGPYRSFRKAEGDAKAWGGTVEPVHSPDKRGEHEKSETQIRSWRKSEQP